MQKCLLFPDFLFSIMTLAPTLILPILQLEIKGVTN